ncbi:GIY-YIG nuclease family protein [Fluviicola sp.]|uniref:GIY-YIG nuclease family protein n=1 Tax=Fluviicola sp. TaxID=1917219 RepID=UPI0031D99B31
MCCAYILYSSVKDKFYTGVSENPAERLKKHNSKNKGFTNQASDWKIVFLKPFDSKSEALAYEKQIKAWKSKIKIQKLIRSATSEHPDASQSGGADIPSPHSDPHTLRK